MNFLSNEIRHRTLLAFLNLLDIAVGEDVWLTLALGDGTELPVRRKRVKFKSLDDTAVRWDAKGISWTIRGRKFEEELDDVHIALARSEDCSVIHLTDRRYSVRRGCTIRLFEEFLITV